MAKTYSDRDTRIPSGCGVTGIINRAGERFFGDDIYKSICNMMERGNGLGSGFGAYGIYPEFENYWCYHVMYDTESAKAETEEYINRNFKVVHSEPMPTNRVHSLKYIPILHRYFLNIQDSIRVRFLEDRDEEEFIINSVMHVNRDIKNAFVFSSGKNMGVFKGVGNPDEIGDFFKIPDYKGWTWIAHNRFPTNSVGWWGGAHPFSILDWSVVHNGEISSYGINRRYLENAGYSCTLSTDTEVITYLFHMLVDRHGHDFDTVQDIISAPFWSQIEREPDPERKERLKTLRMVYGPALLNGPFAVIVANSECMVGINDRTKLRPLVAAEKGDFLYVASEEAAIREACPDPERVWMPRAGKFVIGKIRGKKSVSG